MSKYITHFQTEAAYQSALPTLDLPNVSLVDELGEVHYHRALYGAHAGDIALYDVAEGQKIVVTAEDWNLTTYPTASYPIIGVVVADESALGCLIFRQKGVKADGTESQTSANYYSKIKWGDYYIDWGLTKYGNVNDAKTDLNGKTNTAAIIAAIKAYDLAHSTDNITGFIGEAIEKFSTAGTTAGDWFTPSAGQIMFLYENNTVINTTLAKINNADNTLAVSGLSLSESYNTINSSTEKDANYYWYYNSTYAAKFNHEYKNMGNNYFIPFAII